MYYYYLRQNYLNDDVKRVMNGTVMIVDMVCVNSMTAWLWWKGWLKKNAKFKERIPWYKSCGAKLARRCRINDEAPRGSLSQLAPATTGQVAQCDGKVSSLNFFRKQNVNSYFGGSLLSFPKCSV